MGNRSKRCLQEIWNKLTVALLVLAVMIMISPISAKAKEATTGTLGDNGGITWTYDGETKTLTLTGEDSGLNGEWDDEARKTISKLKTIANEEFQHIVLENCTIKGDALAMFAYLSEVESISFKNVDTSLVTGMAFMFDNCSELNALDLREFNTENVTDMSAMFQGCWGLTSLDVSSFSTKNVTDMSAMFNYCEGLTVLDVSGFDTQNVIDMRGMFNLCGGLTALDVSDFNTEKVTEMVSMFNGCTALTSLDVNNFNTEQVTDMYSMFSRCSNLSSLDLSGFSTEKVSNMNAMFLWCHELAELDLSSFDTKNVTTMALMFQGCWGLTSLDVSNFNTENVTNMSGMFEGCSGLTSLDVSNFNTENVMNMSGMFDDCSGLTSLDVSNFKTEKVENAEQLFFNCSKITDLDLSNFDLSNAIYTNGILVNTRKIKTLKTPKAMPENLTITLSDVFQDENGTKYTVLSKDNINMTLVREASPFADVAESSWQYEYVKYALNNNLMKGKNTDVNGNIIFDPNTEMTRAEFVQTLYNKEGKPEVTYTDRFPDVSEGKWYTNAILWAAENNIVAGKGNGNFDVNGNITRQEMATILYKYANSKNYYTVGRAELTDYTDADTISSWAVENMKWAIFEGIMKGKGERLAPLENATRAECATMLCNFMSSYE